MSTAIQFIKDHGVEKAREVVDGAPEWATNFNIQISYTKASNGGEYTFYKNLRAGDDEYSLHYEMGCEILELKRLVESVERIDGCGGLHGFKTYCNGDFSQEDLQVIADYEAIYLQEKCQHGYDIACLLCGFGTVDGKRVYHGGADSK